MGKFDPRVLEPFWGSWYIEELIGEGSFGSVYKISKEELGKKYYSALKIISIPKSDSETTEALYGNPNQKTAAKYFQEMAEVIYKEVQIMYELKGKTNVISFEDYKIIKKEDGIGYHILIRMELLTCFSDYLRQNDLTSKMLCKIGKDLCKALMLCKRKNIIHRDIKPANIFVTEDGDFKLGDFGIARQLEDLESRLSIKGTYRYMAPEIYLGNPYDTRADIYSLGMVLYYYLNQEHVPFTDPYVQIQKYGENREALRRRFAGDELPDPVCGSKAFIQVVKKACAYSPDDRYLDAESFLRALEKLPEEEEEILCKARNDRNIDIEAYHTDDATISVSIIDYKLKLSSQDGRANEPSVELSKEEVEQSIDEIQEILHGYEDIDEEKKTNVLIRAPQWDQLSKKNTVSEEKDSEQSQRKDSSMVVTAVCLGVAMVGIFIAVTFVGKTAKVEIVSKESETSIEQQSGQETEERSQEVTDAGLMDTKSDVAESDTVESDTLTTGLEQEEKPAEDNQNATSAVTEEDEDDNSEDYQYPSLNEDHTVTSDYEVEENNLGITDYTMIEDLDQVTSLILQNNELTNTKDLNVAVNLTYLDLQENKITSLEGLENLSKLECLNLQGNRIDDLSELSTLTSLDTLILSENDITDLSDLANLTSVRELRLNSNQMLREVGALKNLTNLQVLDLSDTIVSDITCLYEINSLFVLNVKNTLVSENQIEIFKQNIPGCTVIQ